MRTAGFELARVAPAATKRRAPFHDAENATFAAACDALRQHRKRQNAARLAAVTWDDQDLVFTNDRGRPLDPSGQTAVFKAAWDVPAIRCHAPRHTTATLLLSKGVRPKMVAGILGHATTTITLDIHSAYVPALHIAAASIMDTILSA